MKFQKFWNGTVPFEMLIYSLPETNQLCCPSTVRPEIAPKGNESSTPTIGKNIRGLWCLVSGRASCSAFFFVQNTAPQWGILLGQRFLFGWHSGIQGVFFLLHFGEVFSQVQERVVGFWFFPYGDFVVGNVATGVTSSVRSGRNCCRDRGEVIIREQFLLTSEEICRVGWAQFLRWKKRRKQVEIA